ncbi:hypothetical protein BCR37DRAFT_379896 [Protomyces lactucae-debilis]|uniref:Uncharacterized protein n=1 Tax=Protomyces lactucae-debilis TaxID=2754530 RepID=A0A1Y2FGP5_PROLT|nr:uncharacterized protein BCR37DRAFT_379896 [Protomyces lactucae-debilis]ORY81985.1 hypothetical protein BCR37DRAFT_379896 [Protomyces lactucae-debilis]
MEIGEVGPAGWQALHNTKVVRVAVVTSKANTRGEGLRVWHLTVRIAMAGGPRRAGFPGFGCVGLFVLFVRFLVVVLEFFRLVGFFLFLFLFLSRGDNLIFFVFLVSGSHNLFFFVFFIDIFLIDFFLFFSFLFLCFLLLFFFLFLLLLLLLFFFFFFLLFLLFFLFFFYFLFGVFNIIFVVAHLVYPL